MTKPLKDINIQKTLRINKLKGPANPQQSSYKKLKFSEI